MSMNCQHSFGSTFKVLIYFAVSSFSGFIFFKCDILLSNMIFHESQFTVVFGRSYKTVFVEEIVLYHQIVYPYP